MLIAEAQHDLDGASSSSPAEAGPTQPSTVNFVVEAARPAASGISHDVPDAVKGFQALSTSAASPKFSFGSRAKASQTRFKAPGPGSYMDPSVDFNSRHKRLPRFGFGTDTRLVKLASQTPGPGSYAVAMVLGSDAAKIACTPRREAQPERPRQKAPGPGAYNLPDFRKNGPKVSMTPRREQDVIVAEQTPGPGEYHTASQSSRTPRFSFGTARQRAAQQTALGSSTPGPGAYRNHQELPHDPSNLRARHR